MRFHNINCEMFERAILCFGTVFLPHNPLTQTYQYFLEDDSIAVIEIASENSGLPQGLLIKRQAVPKPQGGFYDEYDLNVGQQVTFYARTFRITDCDEFTKKWMAENGVQCGQTEQVWEWLGQVSMRGCDCGLMCS